jgi:hypothetical protein
MLDLQGLKELLCQELPNKPNKGGISFENFLPTLQHNTYIFKEKEHTQVKLTSINKKEYSVLETDAYKGKLSGLFKSPYGKTSEFVILRKTKVGYIFYCVECKSKIDIKTACLQIRGSFRLISYLIHTLCDHQKIEMPVIEAKGLILFKALYTDDPDETSFSKQKQDHQNWHPRFTIKTKEISATSEYTLEEFLKFF